jgi:Nucleotidyl transferase AbiEii toxin, Type IV TA system
MSSLNPHQVEIARILFALPAAADFALAGGSALLALGAIDRPTRDIDAFVAARPGPTPGDVRPLAADLTSALTEAGWKVALIRSHETFTRLIASQNDTTVDIDLAVDSPPLFPIEHINGIPVLAAQDLAARKILATIDRAEGRDFTDLHALAEQFGRTECIRWAQELDAGLTSEAIANAFDQLDRLNDDELPSTEPAGIRSTFESWASQLRNGRPDI